MPDLLLELFSEEIPARMQRKAAEDLKSLLTNALVERGCLYEGAKAFVTPRRLALHIVGLPAKQPDQHEEKKGPRVGAPDGAIQGFLKSAGLTDIAQARIVSDPKKGEFYVAVVEKAGRPLPELLAELIPEIIRTFPWPKSMRWGKSSAEAGSLRWVRPLQSILCTFGPETETPDVVRFEIGGIVSSDVTRGHRFMAPDLILVRRFDDYVASLERAKVVLDADRRKDIILTDARNLAFARGLELVEDEGLLEEVAGLVEWPVVLMGSFDESFLAIPPEVVRATIRANQKCFVLRNPATGKLSNHFVLVSNIDASDGGAQIVAGNQRVVRARLSDARHFWELDQKPLPGYESTPGTLLDQRLAKLRALNIVFHEKLGTQGARVDRIVALARELAPIVGADPEKAARAATLAKADLVTEMVGEFPEVQGLMGRRYAELQGEDASVAAAIEDHYKPQGPSDRVPTDPVSVAVALADKLDTLVGFWAIGEVPTGSKDPYALRRAALGLIRMTVENSLSFSIEYVFWKAFASLRPALLTRSFANTSRVLAPYRRKGEQEYVLCWGADPIGRNPPSTAEIVKHVVDVIPLDETIYANAFEHWDLDGVPIYEAEETRISGFSVIEPKSALYDLLSFFHDRLKVYLRDQGARHDLIDAVLASGQQDDLLMIVRRVEALGSLLATEDGKNLLAGYRRAANILRIEEKKDGVSYNGFANPDLMSEEEEALSAALGTVRETVLIGFEDGRHNFERAINGLATLRPFIDVFFEKVTVNADKPELRINRLSILADLRQAMHTVADFSRIEG